MATSSPTPVLTDDHIDLLVTAAASWHILTSATTAAFATGVVEKHVMAATAAQAGRTLRAANAAAVAWLAAHGRERLVDRVPASDYEHRPVDGHLDPVEVIKAVHAAEAMCSPAPSWRNSAAQRLLAAVITAAEHRLVGYASAPWSWTRPERRGGPAVGVAIAGDQHPQVPGMEWITPQEVRDRWETASLVIVRPSAAPLVPADLPPRAGVVVLITDDEHHNAAWSAVIDLGMACQVWFWPLCRDWLTDHLSAPTKIVERRAV
ncbi:hypothetical protein Xcel_3450 (plasmid) [Xylanimonas cellulosilytica DSM 15894]|uniref:Rv3660c-like CheY-like N-terminal domain-containing protein n=1 Tax=Xylanimonas cellulosilytica (strain DSM 15894 / JCM 12276 / CECT 5975 / KCTC 9989 / LMG 20990 / NBRC 107835 / XIL07) TaxID=446471 RepID=D1C0Y3_XYLCX|nr:hypothetical protein [Xylanimonas cellulosilytica]ACZ32449.1 hypothetical protein Xcel_3450 [Xylanimonas cellulosilytica DSM 15894]